jgi:HK97 family phage portal protein
MRLSNILPWRKPKPVQEKGYVPTDQGWMDTNWDWGWWQQDLKPLSLSGVNETVEACVSALSQTVAMLDIYHLEDQRNGEAVRQYGSVVERTMLNPNRHTSRNTFINNLIRCLYFHGNGYAYAERNGNGSVAEMYLLDPRNVNPVQDPESGDVYYWASPKPPGKFNPDTDNVYLERDILHIKINLDSNNPLKGVSPLTAAANSIAASNAITGHQARFFNNMARPSGVLTTDAQLNREQMLQLRDAVAKQTQGNDSGKVPILGNGLKWESMSLTSQDAQMVEALGMTIGSISRVFRVPLAMINSMENATFNNAEQMMRWFESSGLGYLVDNIELELTKLFGLPFNQRVDFDIKKLLRADWSTQISTLGEGVLKGIYSPNEARAILRMGPVKDGDEPRVQQQVVPLSAWDETTTVPNPEPTQPDEVMASLSKGFASYGR